MDGRGRAVVGNHDLEALCGVRLMIENCESQRELSVLLEMRDHDCNVERSHDIDLGTQSEPGADT